MPYFHCIKSNVNAGGYGYGVKRHFQQYFSYIVMVDETKISGENLRPVASRWQGMNYKSI
jgi:hypothetical protein